jgi:dienelactone hydrolase
MQAFWLSTFLALVAISLPLSAAAAQPIVVEAVSFDTNVPPRRPRSFHPVRLEARFYLPVERAGALSAMVITPSNAGVRSEREIFYAETLARNGIAALVIDSFSSRGVTSVFTGGSRITPWQSENDAFAGLQFLLRDSRIRSDRIGVMGVSRGGSVALQAMFRARQPWRGLGDLAFAAHVSIAPFCNFRHRNLETTGRPALFLLAGRDDQTPPETCLKLIDDLRKDGHGDISLRIYDGAYHGWETIGPRPLFRSRIESLRGCNATIEDDGTFTVANSRVRLRPPAARAWMRRNCMRRGSRCCGGTARLRNEAAAEIVAFLKAKDF